MGARYKRSEAISKQVSTFSAVGCTQDEIARVLHMKRRTLTKHYSDELQTGKIKGVASVGSKALNLALGGDRDMIKFYLRCQGNWSEKAEGDKAAATGELADAIRTAWANAVKAPPSKLVANGHDKKAGNGSHAATA